MADDELNSNRKDYLASVGKALAAAVPFAGGALSEIVGHTIPGLREDRIVEYLRQLSARLEKLERTQVESLSSNSEKLDLIEQGGRLAASSTTPERISQVVEAVINGISADDAKVVRQKRLLRLFGELDNDEVAILTAYGRSYAGGDRNAFDAISRPDPMHLGGSREMMRENALYEIASKRLLDLGLLRKNIGNLRKGQLPEFDSKDGLPKGRLEISYLGRMLLREVGIEIPFED